MASFCFVLCLSRFLLIQLLLPVALDQQNKYCNQRTQCQLLQVHESNGSGMNNYSRRGLGCVVWIRGPMQASHQYDPGSIPGLGIICGLSLLVVLILALRGFSLGTPVFPSPQKPTLLNSNSIWKVSPISGPP